MSFRKSILAMAVVAQFATFGVLGSAGAAAAPTASASQVLDLIVEASGATTERGLTPRDATINRRSLRINAASCADGSDWLSYYVGPVRIGSKVEGAAGGILCNGERRFQIDPAYLPSTYEVWKMMADVTDQAFNQNNKYLYGLYLSSVGKKVSANGKVATLDFAKPKGNRNYSSLRNVRIVGDKYRVIRLFRPGR